MFYIYIIQSEKCENYYVGYSSNPWKRLIEHNTSKGNTYTSKYRPWILKAVFLVSKNEYEAIRLERFIKKQKSKRLIEKLCDSNFCPSAELAQMVRVPHLRD